MKAASYCRYSSDNQREESIQAQSRAIKEYANKEKIQIVKIYTDEARSATTDNRPGFLQMIKDSEMRIFDLVLVHKLDRFARNRYDSAFYKRELKQNGVKLKSVLENLDDSPESIILESVLEGMNEYYSANLSREVMKGMKETALQCKHTGGKPPLGYDVAKDKTYVINEQEARAVKLMYELHAEGKGYTIICDTLNNQGYRTQTGRLFSRTSIYNILINEKYKGVYVFNRTESKINGKRNHSKSKEESEIIRIKDGMPEIVNEDLWNKVNDLMKSRKKGTNSAKENYLLSGLIICGKCSGSMVGNRRKAGRNKRMYKTYEYSTRKRAKGCDMKAVNKEYVEKLVIDQLVKDIFSPAAINKIVKDMSEYTKKQTNVISKDIKVLNDELTGIETEIGNIVNAIASGMFHASMKEKMDLLETRKSIIQTRIAEAKLQLDIHIPSEEVIRNYLEKDSDIKNKSLDDQKKTIQTFISKVAVYPNDIEINTIVDYVSGGGGS